MLLAHVRVVLERHGLSLGDVPLPVHLMDTPFTNTEGWTTRSARPSDGRRIVGGINLRPGLDALHAAQVLAHEYMHAWLWLQKFPPMPHVVEEGLAELASYLYLVSLLHADPAEASLLVCDEPRIRAQIRSIETNGNPAYGGGFRACVSRLRGRSLHQLLAYVREHGVLPPTLF